MGTALRGGDGVAIRLDKAIPCWGPVDGPLDLAGHVEFFLKIHGSRKWLVGIGCGPAQRFAQIVGQTAGKVENRFLWGFAIRNF